MEMRAPRPRAVFAVLPLVWSLVSLPLLFLLAGCEDDKAKTSAVDAGADDGGPNQALLGGKLGEAVAAAAAAPGATAAPTANANAGGDGPPENGLMGPVAADKAHPRGAPPKVEIFAEGSEPRVTLAPKLEAGTEQKLTLSVTRSQMPLSLDIALAFKVEKKGDKKKADAAKDAPAAAEGPPGSVPVVGKIAGASVTAQVEVPEDLTKAVTSLKGSQLRFFVSPDGSISDFSRELAKGADKAIDNELGAILEAFTAIVAPMPQKPVGVGAYWLVTDRGKTLGAEMVRYRVFRLVSLEEGGGAKLSVELRQYSTEPSLNVPDQQGGTTALPLDKWDSQGKGEVRWSPAGFLPASGEMQSQTQALAIPPGQPNRRAQIQAGARMKISSN